MDESSQNQESVVEAVEQPVVDARDRNRMQIALARLEGVQRGVALEQWLAQNSVLFHAIVDEKPEFAAGFSKLPSESPQAQQMLEAMLEEIKKRRV